MTSSPPTKNPDDRHRRPPKPRKSHSSSTSSSYGSADTHPAGNFRKHDTGQWNDDSQTSTWRNTTSDVVDDDGRRPPPHEEGSLPTILPPHNCYRNSYQHPRGYDEGHDDDEDGGRDDWDYDHEFLPLTRSPLFQNGTTAVTVFVLSLLLLGCWSQLDPMAHDFDGNGNGGFYGPNVHGVNMNTNMNMNMKRNVDENNIKRNEEDAIRTAATSTSSENSMAAGATAASSSFFRNNNQNELQLQLQSQPPNNPIETETEQSPATSDFYQNYTKFYTTYPRRPFITHHRPLSSPITLPILGFPSLSLAIYPNATTQQPLADRAVRHAVETLSVSYFDVAPEYGDGIAQSRLGPALRPYRSDVFLAAKTMYRTATEAEIDLNHTLEALQTDYLDLYQFHSLSTMDEVDLILSPGGAMETFRKAQSEGRIRAIGFSAHDQDVAVRMIRTGWVDTCMFPINFAAYHYGKVGQKVLEAAEDHGVGVIALKSGAKGRLTNATGTPVTVPPKGGFRHIPEWKRQEMIRFPVMTSKDHPTEWYEPEEDEEYLMKLVVWSLNQRGVTAVLPPGDLGIFETVARGVLKMCGCYGVVNGVDVGGDGKCRVPELSEEDIEDMMERYKDVKPIFYDWDESGSKVST